MKLEVETIVEGRQREGLAWGMTPDGRAVLVIIAGSRRVLVAMTAHDAIEAGVGGCYVGQGLRMAQAEAAGAAAPQALLVDPMGVPLGGG